MRSNIDTDTVNKYAMAIAYFMGAAPTGRSVSLSDSHKVKEVRNAPAVPVYGIVIDGSYYNFTPLGTNYQGPEFLRYHDSWDRLMEVFDKMEAEEKLHTAIYPDRVFIGGNDEYEDVEYLRGTAGYNKLDTAFICAGEWCWNRITPGERTAIERYASLYYPM